MSNSPLDIALYLVPTPLASGAGEVLPPFTKQVLRDVKHFVVENRRSAIRFLKSCAPDADIDAIDFRELSEHTAESQIPQLLLPVENGLPVALMSEAGCPCMADPGAPLVKMAHERGIKVKPLAGSSSVILALMASGMNGQNFAFSGYLPVKNRDLSNKLKKLEARAWKEDQTQIFIEAPYRNLRTFAAVLATCQSDTLLCVAADLTGRGEFVRTLPIYKWQKELAPAIDKVPTIFLLSHS